jgi:hypothetical protein
MPALLELPPLELEVGALSEELLPVLWLEVALELGVAQDPTIVPISRHSSTV